MRGMRGFRAKSEGAIEGPPPEMRSHRVFMSAHERASVGCAYFQPVFREVDLPLSSARAFCSEILIVNVPGVVSRVADRKVRRGHRRAAQHAANTGTCVHDSNA